MTVRSWRCFHCGDVFRNPRHAASHFGIDELQTPGCVAVLRHGESHLLDRIRDLEGQLARYRNEDSDIMRWAQTKAADHAAALRLEEEKGYARGLRDMLAERDEALALLKHAAQNIQGCIEERDAPSTVIAAQARAFIVGVEGQS